jgi:hypothetical protein
MKKGNMCITATYHLTLHPALESHDTEATAECYAGGHSSKSTLSQILPVFFAAQCMLSSLYHHLRKKGIGVSESTWEYWATSKLVLDLCDVENTYHNTFHELDPDNALSMPLRSGT